MVGGQGRASKGLQQCQGADLESECPLWRRAAEIKCSWRWRVIWGGEECLCEGRAWGLSPVWGYRGPGLLSSAWLCGLRWLCGQAAALNQWRIFITAVHVSPRSWKAYHKGHIFKTPFNPTILSI